MTAGLYGNHKIKFMLTVRRKVKRKKEKNKVKLKSNERRRNESWTLGHAQLPLPLINKMTPPPPPKPALRPLIDAKSRGRMSNVSEGSSHSSREKVLKLLSPFHIEMDKNHKLSAKRKCVREKFELRVCSEKFGH